MYNRNLIISVLAFLQTYFSFELSAQSEVIKMSAMKSNSYGVTYLLPKTMLTAEIEYSKITEKAGPYAKYAERYLGISDNGISEDRVYYSLDKVDLTSKGVPNKEEAYIIEFKVKTSAPFVCLTKDGVICSINAEYESVQKVDNLPLSQVKPVAGEQVVSAQSAFTEEYLRAGSIGKMAEVAAKQIYKLRESRMDILTGDADNVPRDGEAMKIVLQQLEAQEKALVELFIGSRTTEKQQAAFEFEPVGSIENQIIFRFSKYLGVVDPENLSGTPVYINLKKLDVVPESSVDAKSKESKVKADAKAIIYNLPGKASIEMFYGKQQLFKEDMQIVQFGTTQTLSTSMFEDKKGPIRVYFYPETGAIKQILQ